MGLDFRFTCPEIDKNIKLLKIDIVSHLSDMLDECCPLIEGEQKDEFIDYYVKKYIMILSHILRMFAS